MVAEAVTHQSTPNQTEQKNDVTGKEGNLQESSLPDDNIRDAGVTAESALLTARPSAAFDQTQGKPAEGSRLSLRSSRSLADNIRFQPNTKVYIKAEKTDKRAHEEGMNAKRKEGVTDQHESVNECGTADKVRSEVPSPGVSSHEKNEKTLSENEDFGRPYAGDIHKQPSDSGLENLRDQQKSRSTNPCAIRGTDIRHPVDQASFSDMIRKTLQKNRSSLLPKGHNLKRQSTSTSPPLISLLGTSDFPYSVCSPSALSASQTSLASGQFQESSDIYDVPKSSGSDWQRAMSLLSLSAIGSGVLPPTHPRKEDDYIDMTQGLRGGSVPDLHKVGRRVEDGVGEEGNYYLVPSNKHAYINLMYPREAHQDKKGSRSDLLPSQEKRRETSVEKYEPRQERRQETSVKEREPRFRPGRTTSTSDETKRRWSSSEQKTHELVSCPPSTATLHSYQPRHPANLSRHEPVQTSAKLFPAPRVKLYPGKQTISAPQANQIEVGKTGELHRAPADANTSTKARTAGSPNESPSYVKVDRNPEMSHGTYALDGRLRDDSDEKSAEDDRHSVGRSGTREHSQSPENRRPRLPSVQRNSSYSQAVGTREATEGEREKGEQFKRFPFCMEDYVIIPTPRQSRSSSECSPVDSKESYC